MTTKRISFTRARLSARTRTVLLALGRLRAGFLQP